MTRRGTTLSREGIAERRLFTHTGLGSTFHLQYADAWLKDTLTALWKTRCSVDRPYACSTLTPTSFINTVAHQRGWSHKHNEYITQATTYINRTLRIIIQRVDEVWRRLYVWNEHLVYSINVSCKDKKRSFIDKIKLFFHRRNCNMIRKHVLSMFSVLSFRTMKHLQNQREPALEYNLLCDSRGFPEPNIQIIAHTSSCTSHVELLKYFRYPVSLEFTTNL